MHTASDRARVRTLQLALIGVCTAVLASACTKQPPTSAVENVETRDTQTTAETQGATPSTDTASPQLDWAREALRRNPYIEVLATDTTAGVFTLRMKDTGEVRTVRVTELAAVPVSALLERAPATTQPMAETSTETATAATSAPKATPDYTIERSSDGQIKVTGPGVSIVSASTPTVTATERPATQRTVEPIICEGRRMLHFDRRDIYVEGDAIVARDGCELYITNSRVAATGTGVVVRDAIVHISNSTIEGAAASFDAGDGARVILRGSRFDGIPRRSERAIVQDQGGNQWQ